MINRQPSLGDRVECKVTGFTGIVTGHARHLSGCDRLWVSPPVDRDGKTVEGQWLDIDMVYIVQANVLDPVTYMRHAPGGVDLPASK